MGKIRIAALGDEEKEKQRQEKIRVRREQKKLREGLDVEKKENKAISKPSFDSAQDKPKTENRKPKIENRSPKTAGRSKRYQDILSLVDRNKLYPLSEALELVKKTSTTAFIASIDAHFNLSKKLNIKKAENLKFEKKAPLAHGRLGKVDQKSEDLKSAYEKMVKTIGPANITKITLASSMGPGIKVEI